MNIFGWLVKLFGGRRKPAPQPVPPPVGFDVIVVDSDSGAAVVGATVTVDHFDQPFVQTTNADGYVYFIVPGTLVDTWIKVDKDGYEELRWGTIHPREISSGHNVLKMVALAKPMPRIVAEQQHFKLANGDRFTAIEASGFTLYQQYLDGADIKPVLNQLQDLGFNMVRVFGMYNNPPDPNTFGRGGIGRFIPAEYGDRYFSELVGFYKLLSRYGLYGEFTAFADATQIIPDVAGQVAHWDRLIEVLRPIDNALVEAVNEMDQTINHLVGAANLTQPEGVFASHGSNGSQQWPVDPKWDYATFHTNGAPEEQRKVGHNAMEIWNGPTLTNETSRDTLPQPHDSAAGAALLCAGSCYHTSFGKYGRVLEGDAIGRAQAFVAGAKEVPLESQDGAYIHRADLETASILRAYQRAPFPYVALIGR